MGSENKLVKGMFIGALTGAALSMLDEKTRKETVIHVKEYSKNIWSVIKHPKTTYEKVSHTAATINKQIQEVAEEASYIMSKINDIKETNPIEKDEDGKVVVITPGKEEKVQS